MVVRLCSPEGRQHSSDGRSRRRGSEGSGSPTASSKNGRPKWCSSTAVQAQSSSAFAQAIAAFHTLLKQTDNPPRAFEIRVVHEDGQTSHYAYPNSSHSTSHHLDKPARPSLHGAVAENSPHVIPTPGLDKAARHQIPPTEDDDVMDMSDDDNVASKLTPVRAVPPIFGPQPCSKRTVKSKNGRRRSCKTDPESFSLKRSLCADEDSDEGEDDDDHSTEASFLVGIDRETFHGRIDDMLSLRKVLYSLLNELNQTVVKELAKLWIKVCEPAKQSRYPYKSKNGKNRKGSATVLPPWWPEDVIHTEPDHLKSHGRMLVVINVLLDSARKGEGYVQALREKSQTCNLYIGSKHDSFARTQEDRRKRILSFIYQLAQSYEDYIYEGIDGSAAYVIPAFPRTPRPPRARIGPKRVKRSREHRTDTSTISSISQSPAPSQELVEPASQILDLPIQSLDFPQSEPYPAQYNLNQLRTFQNPSQVPRYSPHAHSSERNLFIHHQENDYQQPYPNLPQQSGALESFTNRPFGNEPKHLNAEMAVAEASYDYQLSDQQRNEVDPHSFDNLSQNTSLDPLYAYDAKGSGSLFQNSPRQLVSRDGRYQVQAIITAFNEWSACSGALESTSSFPGTAFPVPPETSGTGLPFRDPNQQY